MSVIDCRDLACAQPVVTTKKALDRIEEGDLIVIVNNSVCRNNLERFALSQGCSVEMEKRSGEHTVDFEGEQGGLSV